MEETSPRKDLVCYLVASLLLALVGAGSVTAQTDSCGSDLTTFLPAPYSDSKGQICKPVWNTFVLRYSESEDNVMTFVVSALYTAGWVGIGFSKNGMMVNSSAMVGWIGRDNKVRIRQYLLNGTSPSDVLVDHGELKNTSVPPSVIIHGATIYLAFQLQFSSSLARQPLIFAFGTARPKHYRLTPHDDQQTVTFDFSSGNYSSTIVAYPGQLKMTHGLLNIFGWGVILPIGAIIARYFRHWDPMWYYLHTGLQFTGFFIGFAGIVAGIALFDKLHAPVPAHVPAHRGIGIFILCLSILQIIAFFWRPDKDAKIRRYWNWYHSWVGRLALFLAAVNIVLGIQLGGAGNGWKIGYGFNLATILIAVITCEALLWMKPTRRDTIDDPPLQTK